MNDDGRTMDEEGGIGRRDVLLGSALVPTRLRTAKSDFLFTNPILSPPEANIEWTRAGFAGERPHVAKTTPNLLFVRAGTTVSALDKATGERQWTRDHGSKRSVRIDAVSDGRLFVSTEGKLVAIDVETGETEWEFAASDGKTGGYVVTDDSAVYFGQKQVFKLASDDGSVVARFDPGSDLATEPVVQGGGILVGTTDGRLYGLTSALERRWRFSPETARNATDDVMLLPLSGLGSRRGRPTHGRRAPSAFAWSIPTSTLYAISEGREAWRREFDAEYRSFPGVAGENFYCIDGSTLLALSPNTGRVRWRRDVGNELEWLPRTTSGRVYAATDETVYALDKTSGQPNWTFRPPPNSITVVPDHGGFTVRVGEDSRELIVLSPRTGTPAWRQQANHALTWPDVGDDRIFVGSANGSVLALSKPTNPIASLKASAQNPSWLAGTGLVGLLGIALALGGYRYYREEPRDDESVVARRESVERAEFEDGTVVQADDYRMVTKYRHPSVPERDIEVIELGESGLEATNVRDEFVTRIERWANHDSELASVLDWEGGPRPWVAVECPTDGYLDDYVGEWSLATKLRVIVRGSERIHRMHGDGLIHGALTPGSLGVESKPTRRRETPEEVVVSDWDVAALPVTDDQLRRRYGPPEEKAGAETVTSVEADVYRLGAITYYVTTATTPPLDGQESDDCLDTSTIPSPLDEVVAKSTSASPTDRYESVLAFRDALQWAVQHIG